jgi:hypothetical protein
LPYTEFVRPSFEGVDAVFVQIHALVSLTVKNLL